MKTFKELMAEVAQPLSKGEKAFVAAHTIDHKNLVPGVTDQDHVFKGNAQRQDPATASYEKSEDEEVYDKGLKVEEEVDLEEGLNASTIKHMQKLRNMDDKEFAAHAQKAGWQKKDLQSMAWRHGFGGPGKPGHNHYVKRMEKGLNEEIEQVNELSKGTMKSYVKKALDTGSEKSVSNLASRGGYEMGRAPDDDYDAGQKHDRKAVVRSQGIQRAVNKLTKEDVEQVDEGSSGSRIEVKKTELRNGHMLTVRHGSSHSYPLHPEHIEAIRKLKDGEHTKFKDETGNRVTAHREGENVHLTGDEIRTGKTKTTVGMHHFKEEVEALDETSPSNKIKKNQVAQNIGADARKSGDPKHLDVIGTGMRTSVADKIRGRQIQREEAEKLDEVSKGTLKNYIKKAALNISKQTDDRTRAHYNDRDDDFNRAAHKLMNRQNGVRTAVDKLTNEDVEQVDEVLNNPIKKLSYIAKAYKQIKNADPVKMANDPNAMRQVVKRTTGMAMLNKKLTKEEVEEIDEKTLTSAEMKKREEVVKAIKRENPKMDKSMAYAIATKTAKRVAEETVYEEDDFDYEGEMARAELNAICDKAGVLAEMLDDETQLEAWLQSKITKAKYMIDSVYDYMVYSNKGTQGPSPAPVDYSQQSNMASHYTDFLNRMGEETELDEARRGRPRKDGSSSNEEEGGREHIIVQLRKAENLRGERHTEFNDNSKHKLPLGHVKKALDMHQNMKPTQKAEFEARLAKSHSSFHDAVSGKPAEAAKPKVTLAKSAAHMKEAMADPSSMRSDRGDVKPVTIMGKGGRLEVVKRQAARKEIAVGESTEMNTTNVKKLVKHDCAKHVEHAEWGKGQCLPEQHTIVETAEGEGYVSHYDVMFDHGIEQSVPVESLNVLVSESHEHSRKMSEELKGGQKNLDKNKNGKLDSHDFQLLRKTKVVAKPQYDKMRPAFKEEAEQLEEMPSARALGKGARNATTDAAYKSFVKRVGMKSYTPPGTTTKETLRALAAKAKMAGKGGKIEEQAELDESTKVNMAQDSVDKIKKDPLASKEALKLPPSQGNEPVGGEGEIASGAGKFAVAEETLNTLYNSLSEENKKIFEAKYQTEEGKLELLAFAEEQGL